VLAGREGWESVSPNPRENSVGYSNTAVTWIFIPHDRPHRFRKSTAAGADIIIDSEDTVAPASNRGAPENVDREVGIGGGAGCFVVRINSTESERLADYIVMLRAVVQLGLAALQPLGDVVPKAESADEVAPTTKQLSPSLAINVLIEAARGTSRAASITGLPRVSRLAFGTVDLALDPLLSDDDSNFQDGCQVTEGELMDAVVVQLALSDRATGEPPPIASPSTATNDADALLRSAARGRSFRFGAKLCIHPRQIPPGQEAYQPHPAQLDCARGVLDAISDSGTGTLNDLMLYKPVRRRAERLLARERQLGVQNRMHA
jgi:citrate lyase subunit beta/citryl-CoA lyase